TVSLENSCGGRQWLFSLSAIAFKYQGYGNVVPASPTTPVPPAPEPEFPLPPGVCDSNACKARFNAADDRGRGLAAGSGFFRFSGTRMASFETGLGCACAGGSGAAEGAGAAAVTGIGLAGPDGKELNRSIE